MSNSTTNIEEQIREERLEVTETPLTNSTELLIPRIVSKEFLNQTNNKEKLGLSVKCLNELLSKKFLLKSEGKELGILKGYDIKSIKGINSSSYQETCFKTSFKFFYRSSGKAFDSSRLSKISTPSKNNSVNIKNMNSYSLSYKKRNDDDETKDDNENKENLHNNFYKATTLSYHNSCKEKEKYDKYNKYDYSYNYDYQYDSNYYNYQKKNYNNYNLSNDSNYTVDNKDTQYSQPTNPNNTLKYVPNNETFDEYKAKLCLLNEIFNPNDYFNLISLIKYPSELSKNCAYIIFKDGYYPYWESNPNGGKLSLYLNTNEVDNLWELITYLFVCYNEVFIKEVPLVGLVLKMTGSNDKKLELQFWFSDNDHDKCKDFINSLYNLLIAYGLPGLEMKALAYKSFC
jgi:hypothetical protein